MAGERYSGPHSVAQASQSVSRPDEPADELVDQLTPAELDWRRLVRRYPLASLLVAGVGGYMLGRSRGLDVVEQLAGFAADQVTRHVNEELGEEVL